MGAAASAVANALDHSKEDEAKAKEQLELMMKLADARLDTFKGVAQNDVPGPRVRNEDERTGEEGTPVRAPCSG